MINNLFKKTAAILSIITISLLAQVVNAKSAPLPGVAPDAPAVSSESTEEDSSVKKPAKMPSTMKKPGGAMKTNSRG